MPTLPSPYLAKRFNAMLRIFDSLSDIDFRCLMDVYEEGNRINGKKYYPNYYENLQIIYAEQDFYAYLVEFFKEPTARYAVWIYECRYAAALRIERYHDGLLLNALETAPAMRRSGFAGKLVCAVIEHLQTSGKGVLYSHVNKNDVFSLKVHLSCGFRIVSDQAVYLDGTVRSDSVTLAVNY